MKHTETFYTTKKINNFKIAVFSDIHYYDNFNLKTLNKIEKQVKQNNPDYICIIGDILDESKVANYTPLLNFLSNIGDIAPVICVLGNHDGKCGSLWKWECIRNEELIKQLKNVKNLHLLEDSIYQDNNITFYGFNLSFNYYEKQKEPYNIFCEEINNLKTNLPKDTYNILLFHSPTNIYDFIKNNPNHELAKIDLVLNGHTHNGCLPYCISHPLNKLFKTNRGLLSPQRKLFPKMAQGKVTKPYVNGYIFEAITKLSHSTRKYHYLDCLFTKNIAILNIKKSN